MDSGNTVINIAIIDDHNLVVDGLKALINNAEQLHCSGTAENGQLGIEMIRQYTPDAVLLDIEMPGMSGIEVCKILKKEFPDLKIIALTMLLQPSVIYAMQQAGVDGFLAKNTSSKELLFAISEVIEGHEYYSEDVKASIKKGLSVKNNKPIIPSLSRREKEIVRLIMDGNSTKEIGKALFIAEGTVETHRSNILNKLKVKNVAELVKVVLEHRLL